MNILDSISGQMNGAMANIETIENKLYSVQDIVVPAPNGENWKLDEETGILYQDPKTKVIYASDGTFLGATGDKYESLQPKDFFNAVVDNIRDCGLDLDLSKLEYKVRANKKVIEFKLPTSIKSFKNKAGKQDDTEMFLFFTTGFGGYHASEGGIYSHRFICGNGMRIINADVQLRFKHTNRMNVKALAFTEEIIKIASKVESTTQQWEEMDSVQVTAKMEETFLRKLANIKKDEKYADLSTRKQNIYDAMKGATATEFARTGTTVWGLLNGATYYTNHVAKGCEHDDYVMLKTGANTNKKAQEMALELIS